MDWFHPLPVGDVFRCLTDFVFPPLCYSCGELLPRGCRIACPACVAAMRPINRADPLFLLARERLCEDGTVDELFSLFRFEKGGDLQSLMHHMKYSGAIGVGRWLGERLGSALQSGTWTTGSEAIIPIPLHTIKKRERGYNQSEQIARGAGKILGMPVETDLVRRIRHTRTQTTLGMDERRQNTAGAFVVPQKHCSDVEGRGFLLVDDVITTGATIRSCAQALRSAGARRIAACSVGLADRTNM